MPFSLFDMEVSFARVLSDLIRFWESRAPTAFALFTKGKLLIFAKAVASVVCMLTEFSHFEAFRMVTAPARRTLSIYFFVTGKSELSISIAYFDLLANARSDKKAEGLLREKELLPLSVN